MVARQSLGRLQIRIDVASGDRTGGEEDAQAASSLFSLTRWLNELELPATWSVSRPAQVLVDQLDAVRTRQDLAWQPAPSLRQGSAMPEAFRESDLLAIQQVFARFRRPLDSIVMNSSQARNQAELLARSGIQTVTDPVPANGRSSRDLRPRVLRYGVTLIPAVAPFPGRGRLLGWFDMSYEWKKAVTRAMRTQSSALLVVDGPAVLAGGRPAWKSLEACLRTIARIRDLERIHVESLAESARRLRPVGMAEGQQSILVRAA